MCEISVIIPNYNGKQYLQDCLDSLRLQDYPDFETILVDNGSKDGSREFLEKYYPEVRVLPLKENTGFCGAVNAGIEACESPYVILLNNDTIAEKSFVSSLAQAIKEKENAFSCQAKMLQIQDREKIDDAGNFYCALGWAFARGKGKPETGYEKEEKIFASCGGASIYRREFLEKTGYFDPEHFAYLEDLDLGYRARLLGYENWFCPKARVCHVGSGTTGSRYNLFKVRYSSRNNVYMIYKNMPFLQILWNFPLLLAGFSCKALFFAGKGFGREYLAGLKNGIRLARNNPDRRMRGIPLKSYIRIQLELYQNIGRFLKK